jgi:hypothetical protein
MPDLRLLLLAAGVVGLALAVLAITCLVTLMHAPVPHSAWRTGLSAVVVTGVWWLLNGPLEGPTVFERSYQHGLTLGDVAALPALLLGVALLALAVPA